MLAIEIVFPKTYYVYTYAYPDGKVFYVGKGTGSRLFGHESEAQSKCICNKCCTIREIWEKGQPVQKRIVYETLVEQDALIYEWILINIIHSSPALTNISKNFLALAAIKPRIINYDEDKREHAFRIARLEDATVLSKFSEEIFERAGGYGTPSEIFLNWFKNPHLEIGHILLHKGEITGYFTTHPLHHEQVMKVLNREIRLRQIPIDQYVLLEPGKPLDIYIGDVAANPNIKQASVHLIGKMLTYFHNLGKQGIEIEGIYALVVRPDWF